MESVARRRPARSARAFSVLVEEMRSQFKVFGEALEQQREQMARRFDQVDQRFDQVDRRFDQVDRRFEQVDRRFEQVDQRFERVDRELGLVKAAVLENSREIRQLRGAVEALDAKKADRDEVEGIVERVLVRRR